MSAAPQSVRIPVEEYLKTVYRPDCDYVDGEVLERNLGEKEHSILQQALVFLFRTNRDAWRVEVFPELRVNVGPRRYRIPDVTVVPAGVRWERILAVPALLFIEILSPEDRWSRVR
ncbi:MAG TPA: Uma2 family endonuclease, partial [Acidobacteriaceae bacterium]|nr:Uma2 family endonuclease [Acidobacteriaceae bacterium]